MPKHTQRISPKHLSCRVDYDLLVQIEKEAALKLHFFIFFRFIEIFRNLLSPKSWLLSFLVDNCSHGFVSDDALFNCDLG